MVDFCFALVLLHFLRFEKNIEGIDRVKRHDENALHEDVLEEYGVTSSTGAVYKFNWSASTMTKYTLSGTSVVGKNVTGASNLFTVPDGEMTLSPNYTFNFTNVSGTGLPSFTLPTTGTNKTSTFKGAIPANG